MGHIVIFGGWALLVVALLCLFVSYGAWVANIRARRRRERAGLSHDGASHVSGMWFVPALFALPVLFMPVPALRIAAVSILALDLAPFAVAWIVARWRSPSSW